MQNNARDLNDLLQVLQTLLEELAWLNKARYSTDTEFKSHIHVIFVLSLLY